ncbi:MAG: efflux RND transporter periplasmic adaptor subunit [Rhizobiaceae bacterium]
MRKFLILATTAILLSACQSENDSAQNAEPVVRGLKTVQVQDQQSTTIRRFPSVLQPAEVTTLSFEIGGKLGAVDLKVGQVVEKGQLLASIDPKSLEIQVESAEAAVKQAEATAANALASLERQQELFDKKVTTRSNLDDAQTGANTSAASLQQAEKQLESAKENLTKSDLRSTIDGIVNSVLVESFSVVATGAPVATLYRTDGFESSLSVSYDVVQRLAVGKQVQVRLADNPSIVLAGIVSELGSKADTVSSFPIVVQLTETDPALKAGMAIEISMEFTVPTGQGFLLPLTVLPLYGNIGDDAGPNRPSQTEVYVYDPETETAVKRQITIAGVRENQIIIVDGLKAGERVASAGVSFLRDGQKVKLLDDSK